MVLDSKRLVLIYSTWGTIETVDHIRGKNINSVLKIIYLLLKKPTIRTSKVKPYTVVTFKPDYTRFGLEGLTDDMFHLFKKRTYDIAAVTGKNVKVDSMAN